HWDHLDYDTMLALKPKIKSIICPLGVGAHFEHWGFDAGILHEKDWGEQVQTGNGFSITLTSARHFAGRTFNRNKTLWASFVLQTASQKIFIGGDSGYAFILQK
ncbi:MAG: MBL fold metallo-hydrolase, partial [Chitinophagaceae bacterium]